MKINNLSVLTTDGELLIVCKTSGTHNWQAILKSGCESTEGSLELSIKYNVISLWIYLFLFCIGYLKKSRLFIFRIHRSSQQCRTLEPKTAWAFVKIAPTSRQAKFDPRKKLNLCYYIYFIRLMIFEFSTRVVFGENLPCLS